MIAPAILAFLVLFMAINFAALIFMDKTGNQDCFVSAGGLQL